MKLNNLLFVHISEKVKKDTVGNLYTDGAYSNEWWTMLSELALNITIVMRCEDDIYDVDVAAKKFNKVPADIKFVAVPDINRSVLHRINPLNYMNMNKIIHKAVDEADGVIVRIPGEYETLKYAHRINKPCVAEVVGCPFDALWNHSMSGKLLSIPEWFKMKIGIKYATNLVYVTKEFLQKRYPSNGKSISCSDVVIKNNIRVVPIKEKNIIKIGTAGSLDAKYKGQDIVINALAKLKRQGIECFTYEIAGVGNSARLLSLAKRMGVADQVDSVGSIPHDDIDDWYSTLDVYVQPSRTEGLPRALIEAMSIGLPCIGANVGGIPELLPRENLFRKNSAEELSHVLLKMLDVTYRKDCQTTNLNVSSSYAQDIIKKQRMEFLKEALCKTMQERVI